MNRDKEIKIGLIISYLSMLVSALITILFSPFVLDKIGSDDYGVYSSVSSIITIISILGIAFNSGYVYYFSKFRKIQVDKEIDGLNALYLILYIMISLLCFGIGLIIYKNLELIFLNGFTQSEYILAKNVFIIMLITMCLSLPLSIFQNIILANEKFICLKLFTLLRNALKPIIAIPFLLIGYKTLSYVIIISFVNIFIDILYMIYCIIVIKPCFNFKHINYDLFIDILKYSFFIILHIIADQVNSNLDKIIIGRYCGTNSVSVYSMGFNIFAAYSAIATAINHFFIPKIHSITNDTIHDKSIFSSKMTSLLATIARYQFFLIFLMITGFIFFGKFFVFLWLGDEYKNSFYVALILIISSIPDILQNSCIEIQRALNLHSTRALLYFIMAFLNIVLSIFLSKQFKEIGCAIGTGIANIFIQGIVLNIFYKKKMNLDINEFWKSLIRCSKYLFIPLIFGTMITLFISFKNTFDFLLFCFLYSLLYIISLYIFALNRNEKEYVISFFNNKKSK